MNHIKQLAGQTAVYGIGVVIPRFLNLLLIPWYTRIFATGEYGIITDLYAYVVFLIIFLTYGLETGYFRFSANKDDEQSVYKTTLFSILTTTVIWLVLITLFYRQIAVVMQYRGYEKYILWLGYIVGIDAFTSIPMARLRQEKKAIKYSVIRIVEVSVNLSLNLFFIIYCHEHYQKVEWINKIYNPEFRVGYVLLSNLIASSVKMILLSREIFVLVGNFDFKLWKRLMPYSLPFLVGGLAGAVNEVLDRPLLKYLVKAPLDPMEQLGLYGANFKLAMVVTLFIQMFRYAAEPFFFSKMNDANAKSIYADVLKYFIFVSVGIFLVVMFFIDIFMLFIGKDFRIAVDIVPIILLANILMGIYYNLAVWFKIINRTSFGAMMVITGAIITVGINVIFIPKYSYIASAWGHFFAYFAMVVISFILGRKYYPIYYDFRRILLYIGTGILLFGLFILADIKNTMVDYSLKVIALLFYLCIFAFFENIKNFRTHLLKLLNLNN